MVYGLFVPRIMRPEMDLLEGRRFTVASYGVAAAYAAWLLRQFGASVDHTTALDPEGIGAFLGEGASFDPAPAFKPVPGATFITDAPVTAGHRERLAELAGAGEVIWITPWGLSNSWSERPATDLTLHAAGGWMTSVGEPGREPLGPPGAQGQFVAGLFASIAALRNVPGLEGGEALGRGIVDVPIVQAIAGTMIYDPVAFQYFGALRQRVGNRFAASQPTITTQPCKDGYLGLHCALHGQWLALCQLIGHPELIADPRFASPVARAENIVELDGYLQPWLAERTRFQAYHELETAHIPCSPLPTMAEVLDSPQLRARNSFREVTTPAGRTYQLPGAPARVVADSAAPPSSVREDGPWRPGRVRVVDLSMGWAGPLAGLNLASLGADVIKVESHTHFDWWRGSRPPGDDPAQKLFEHSHVFNATNRGKRGITINLATRRGRELALRLVSTADVLIENFAAGVLEKLGFAPAVLHALNPRLIMLRQPGFGSTGPESGYLTFGNTIEGMSGLTALMGYPGGAPMMMSNAFGDPVSGLLGTVTVQAALAARGRDGRGRVLECAQLEGFLPLTAEALIEYQATGQQPARHGNHRPGHVLSGAFPAAGEDRWVAIDVETAAHEAALTRLAGTVTDAALSCWTAARDRDALVEELTAAGVPAAPVHNESEVLFAEPFSNGFWAGEEREHVGFHQYPLLAFTVAGTYVPSPGPAPTLGQHNAEVFAGMGLGTADITALRAEGIIGEVPTG